MNIPMTAGAHRDLSAELARLRGEREDHTQRLRAARQSGEASNNDELMAIREDEAITEARIARLEGVLARAVIVEPTASGDAVAIGSAVTLRDRASGKSHAYVVDGAHGSLEPHLISALSPMGTALLGQRPGARVEVDLPGGRVRDYELLAVSQGAPA
jgi:transcription elongation factor GreA